MTPKKRLTLTIRMLEKLRACYARMPKYVATAIAGGNTICIGGATSYDNIKRELAKLQDAFGGSLAHKYETSKVLVVITESKTQKVCDSYRLDNLMGVIL